MLTVQQFIGQHESWVTTGILNFRNIENEFEFENTMIKILNWRRGKSLKGKQLRLFIGAMNKIGLFNIVYCMSMTMECCKRF
jgi:hypothetical protein